MLLLTGCDLTEETSNKPWSGYALNKGSGRFEWWFNSHESERDCIESIKAGVSSAPNNQWYAKPVGCGFMSNSYWRVWLMNIIYPDKNFECIYRAPEAASVKGAYSNMLVGAPRRTTSGYCV
jgi:hypothetical protein